MKSKITKILILGILVISIVPISFLLNTKTNKTEDIFLTEEERIWLEDHKNEITIGYTIDYPPVEYLLNGKYVGISADYFKLLE